MREEGLEVARVIGIAALDEKRLSATGLPRIRILGILTGRFEPFGDAAVF
jgi:hypothetical protein